LLEHAAQLPEVQVADTGVGVPQKLDATAFDWPVAGLVCQHTGVSVSEQVATLPLAVPVVTWDTG
jgi:hypothetical protein